MSQRIIGKKTYMRSGITAGTDKVISAYPVPNDGRLNNVWGEVHIISDRKDVRLFQAYGCEGYFVPLDDPWDAVDIDVLWDRFIPKAIDLTFDTGTAAMNIDTTAEDPKPVWQPGELVLNTIFDIGGVPENIFSRREWLSIAKNKPIGYVDVADSAADTWLPTDYFKVRNSKRMRSDRPAYVLYAVGSPNSDETDAPSGTTLENTLNGYQMINAQFITEMIKTAFLQQLGWLGESQDIGDNATQVIQLMKGDDVKEESTLWTDATYQVLAPFTFDISVPGVWDKPVI